MILIKSLAAFTIFLFCFPWSWYPLEFGFLKAKILWYTFSGKTVHFGFSLNVKELLKYLLNIFTIFPCCSCYRYPLEFGYLTILSQKFKKLYNIKYKLKSGICCGMNILSKIQLSGSNSVGVMMWWILGRKPSLSELGKVKKNHWIFDAVKPTFDPPPIFDHLRFFLHCWLFFLFIELLSMV